jgi:uncharacterized protein
MPNKIFLDTSFVIALINDRDENHEQAQALAWIYDGEELLTTEAILLEIGNGLANDFRQEAVAVISALRSSAKTEIVSFTSDLLERGLTLYATRADKQWGLVDCISFVVMRANGMIEALSFDHDFEQAGFVLLEGKE